MLHYQIPSTEYSNYIGHVVNLGLAEDYIAHLRASCASEKTPANRIHAVEQACRHLSGVVDELQPVPVFAQVSLAIQPAGHSYVDGSIPQADAGAALQSADVLPAPDPNSAVDASQLIQAIPEAAQAHSITHAQKTAVGIFKVGLRGVALLQSNSRHISRSGMPARADLPVGCLHAVTGLYCALQAWYKRRLPPAPWLSKNSRSCALQSWCRDRGFADADLLSEAKGLEFATFLVDHGKQRNGLPYTWNSIW